MAYAEYRDLGGHCVQRLDYLCVCTRGLVSASAPATTRGVQFIGDADSRAWYLLRGVDTGRNSAVARLRGNAVDLGLDVDRHADTQQARSVVLVHPQQ